MNVAHRYSRSHSNGDITVIDCQDCGFWHQWPLPSVEDIRETYESRFGKSVRPQFIERKREDELYWNHAFARRLSIYQKLLSAHDSPRILDIGCGVGDFLAYCKKQGFGVMGIEPSESFLGELNSRGIDYVQALIEDISSQQWQDIGTFDIINMSQFLEHVVDPAKVIEMATGNLNTGGILSIECPNDFNAFQLAALRTSVDKAWWINRLHINYFDFSSLESLCSRMGFVPEYRSTSFPLEMFLLFGDNYIENDPLGRQIHTKRVRFENALHDAGQHDLVTNIYDMLSSLGLGRHASVYARKVGGPS